ncbi:uncharacterized protein LOC128510698 [Clarias gariepinus]|uniref:uncharacterized protein LOC128510698 n=1 Tax=Clarias gariepinus TaxID=13013 RepID=UPI00234D82A5|nr:uncharacterized protein LOC128510698 [Clarias gariepinus]
MKVQLTLLLICMLLSEVQSLLCQCVSPVGFVQCRHQKEINCPDQCASLTFFVKQDDLNMTTVVKTCGAPELCSNNSVNMGGVTASRNAYCCNTTFCNSKTLPVLTQQRANGKMCYTCIGSDCSQTMDCVGEEYYCISQTVNQLGNTLNLKGCANKATCGGSGFLISQGINMVDNQCCKGNLCNAAQSFTLSVILMSIPLVFSILYS